MHAFVLVLALLVPAALTIVIDQHLRPRPRS
jgi:hypothetical protein